MTWANMLTLFVSTHESLSLLNLHWRGKFNHSGDWIHKNVIDFCVKKYLQRVDETPGSI